MPVDEFGREIPSRRGSSSSPPPSRSRRHRSRSYSPSPPRRLRHAVERYVDAPMLCEYLWKQQEKRRDEKKNNDSDDDENDDEDLKKKEDNDNDKSDDDKKEESYHEYRHHYCLNYVRSFFNHHLDDSWFRNRYSPLGRKRTAQKEAARAAKEAQCIKDEIQQQQESFVQNARLGGGTKSRKRKHSHDDADDDSTTTIVPKSHLLAHMSEESVICMQQVPPHVTDEQLYLALKDHCSIAKATFKVYSSSVAYNPKSTILFREAYALCDSKEICQNIIKNLHKANYTARRIASPPPSHGDTQHTVVPRKDENKESSSSVLPKVLDLDVDCSDPYGRFEIDEDSKGGAPDEIKVPTRRATVVVSLGEKQPVTVLSAAVSCQERIGRDKEAAVMLARALDVARAIPRGVRLDDLLEVLNLTQREEESAIADVLDVSIAYLRRVHLFSFYNGCSRADGVADVLSGNHAAGTIHLRLKGADELLRQARKETDDIYGDLDEKSGHQLPAKDLLVTRLDDSISKALEQSNEWVSHAGDGLLDDETVNREAAELEELEEAAKAEWTENHGLVDADGRARCSFHFCRKLFRDQNFLTKHLVKKHGEFLRAEVAKCHDSFMMKSWDREGNRPVPPVLVDCGTKFGLVLSDVTGAENPTAADPEPELWRKEEEHRKRLEEQARERYNRDHHYHHHNRRHDADDRNNRDRGDSVSMSGGGNEDRSRGFVDVDDVKLEKVELSFENVEVPVQPPKKKKRKKLL